MALAVSGIKVCCNPWPMSKTESPTKRLERRVSVLITSRLGPQRALESDVALVSLLDDDGFRKLVRYAVSGLLPWSLRGVIGILARHRTRLCADRLRISLLVPGEGGKGALCIAKTLTNKTKLNSRFDK